MSKTVYAVSSGCYSDYTVHRIFESREDAEKHARAHHYDVEEFDYWAAGEEVSVYASYRAYAHKPDGPVRIETDSTFSGEADFYASEHAQWFFARSSDRERAIKSVSDRFAAWKAQQVGIA